MSITQISDFTLRHMIENDRRDKEFQQKQIDRIKQLETELADKDKQLADARAEIESKSRLIEQMREALLLFAEGAIHDFHYVCQHRDNCLCLACQKVRVKAALAAERGE